MTRPATRRAAWTGWTWWLAALGLALAAAPGRAPAQPPPGALTLEPAGAAGAAEHAWSEGVPEERRRAADALFQEGNALLRDAITVSAAAKLRQALGAWDHPNIHYNLALALMGLDQPVETHDHLVAAMRYGPAPLGPERFEHAKNYRALLEQQLVRVRIRCAVPGASVSLDGRPIFAAPGEHEALLRAGRHTVVATKPGYVTHTATRTFEGGQAVDLDLELRTLEDLTVFRRRWPAWRPWAVVGAGAAVALAGGALQYSGVRKIDWVDAQSSARCPAGCPAEPAELARARSQGATFQRAAVVAYAVGGAALVTGAALVVMNRGERTVRAYDVDTPPRPAPRATLELTPVLARDRPGVVATFRY